ncbi:unnamed protein product [Spodoptera exigua]|nr:unnamed protein product [Spodoptera exigua]
MLLRPAVPTTLLYVSRLPHSTKVEEVVEYLRVKTNWTSRVELLELRQSVRRNEEYHFFRITSAFVIPHYSRTSDQYFSVTRDSEHIVLPAVPTSVQIVRNKRTQHMTICNQPAGLHTITPDSHEAEGNTSFWQNTDELMLLTEYCRHSGQLSTRIARRVCLQVVTSSFVASGFNTSVFRRVATIDPDTRSMSITGAHSTAAAELYDCEESPHRGHSDMICGMHVTSGSRQQLAEWKTNKKKQTRCRACTAARHADSRWCRYYKQQHSIISTRMTLAEQTRPAGAGQSESIKHESSYRSCRPLAGGPHRAPGQLGPTTCPESSSLTRLASAASPDVYT